MESSESCSSKHNPKVVGSIPTPATKIKEAFLSVDIDERKASLIFHRGNLRFPLLALARQYHINIARCHPLLIGNYIL